MTRVGRTDEELLLSDHEKRIRALERAPTTPPLPPGSLGEVLSYGGSGWEATEPRLTRWGGSWLSADPGFVFGTPKIVFSQTIPTLDNFGSPTPDGELDIDIGGWYWQFNNPSVWARTFEMEIRYGGLTFYNAITPSLGALNNSWSPRLEATLYGNTDQVGYSHFLSGQYSFSAANVGDGRDVGFGTDLTVPDLFSNTIAGFQTVDDLTPRLLEIIATYHNGAGPAGGAVYPAVDSWGLVSVQHRPSALT